MGSIATTTSLALGSATAGSVLKWIFACIAAGHIIPPTDETATQMAVLLLPVFHILAKIVIAMLERWFGLDLNDNGHIGNGHEVVPQNGAPK